MFLLEMDEVFFCIFEKNPSRHFCYVTVVASSECTNAWKFFQKDFFFFYR